MGQLKGYTSSRLRREFSELKSKLPTLWTRSYYIESVGHISEDAIKKVHRRPEEPVNQIKTYRFKLDPTKAQAQTFARLGTCRYVYNLCLDYKKQLYTGYTISMGKNEIQKELSAVAKDVEWIGVVHSQTLQEVTDRLFKSYDGFFVN